MYILTIHLPELPAGREFEEYIAAYFQVTGHFVERNILERHDEGEVLEIDLVLTDYNKKPLEMKLVEIKSGKCKFSDIFKIRGWMYYLNFSKGIFISKQQSDEFDFHKKIAETIDIDVVQIGDLSKTSHTLRDIIGRKKFDEEDIAVWRYTYWIERAMLKKLKHQEKSRQNMECFKRLSKYQFKADNDVFFNKNIIQRLSGLYDTFYENPRLTAKVGNELSGNKFEGKSSILPNKIFADTFFDCNYNPIQISTYIEHKTRLSILKNAVDYKLLKEAGNTDLTENEIMDKMEFLGIEFEIRLLDSLPASFINNLDEISKDKFYYRYPVFWQVFSWLFGGFILNDYQEEEYRLLSEKTGIPIKEIPNAFEAYNKLFPLDNGWFQELPNSNIMIMKMFPIPFRGIGAHYRIVQHAEENKFENLELTGRHTRKDLIKWNNLGHSVLESDLKSK